MSSINSSSQRQNGMLDVSAHDFHKLSQIGIQSPVNVASLTSSRKLSQNASAELGLNSSNRPQAQKLVNKHKNSFAAQNGASEKMTLQSIGEEQQTQRSERVNQQFRFRSPANSQLSQTQSVFKEGFAEVIRRQLMASQMAQEKQQAQRKQKVAQLTIKQQKNQPKQQFNRTSTDGFTKSSATSPGLKDKKKELLSGKGDSFRSTNAAVKVIPASNVDLSDKNDKNQGASKGTPTLPKSEQQQLIDTKDSNKLSKHNNKKEQPQIINNGPTQKTTIKTNKTSDHQANKPNYPKYQVKEEHRELQHSLPTSSTNINGQISPVASSVQVAAARAKTHERQQVFNSQKYEQLMAQSFIPELSILERRITELNKMPDQLRNYIHRSRQQQQTGVMSILKPSDETSRLLLKQKDGKDGTKMLIAARNNSLSRFTKELKQHQIPANKKVMLNLTPHARGASGLNMTLQSPLVGGAYQSGPGRDSSRKKVNFDLPQITQIHGAGSAAQADEANAPSQSPGLRKAQAE